MDHPSKKKLLVLDLDETLVYAVQQPLARPADLSVGAHHVYLRPHLRAFLAHCARRFELAIWTAASRRYAERIVRAVVDGAPPLAFLWTGEQCRWDFDRFASRWCPTKELDQINGWSLSEIVMADDSPEKLLRNLRNLVAVRPFTGSDDDELPRLAGYLDSLADVADVRSIDKRRWRKRSRPIAWEGSGRRPSWISALWAGMRARVWGPQLTSGDQKAQVPSCTSSGGM